VAFAIDGGLLLVARRQAQADADACAWAAAADLLKNYGTNQGLDSNGTAAQSARTTFKANGSENSPCFTDSNSSLTTNFSPNTYQGGPNTGKAIPPGYVEVIVTYNAPRYFSTVFGSGTMPVSARTVAAAKAVTIGDGIILLDHTAKKALGSTGQGIVSVVNAGIIVNSNASDAIDLTGQGQVSAPTINVVGGVVGQSDISGTINHIPAPVPDPLAGLPAPDPSTLTVQSTSTLHLSGGSGTVTLNPGVYQGGISISGQANVVLNPGIYYMAGGGFSSTGQGNLTGSGVMIYNAPTQTSEGISITGQGSVTISPPTSGIYKGITLYQDHSMANPAATAPVQITGQGNMNMTGTFYTARAPLWITGQGSNNVIGSQYISATLTTTGQGAFNVNWNANLVANTHAINFVE
jgi:hypothetical protein